MPYKTILVCLTTEANAQRLARAACLLAEKFDAHLIGLHTLQELPIRPGASVYITPETVDAFKAEQKRQSEQIKETFLKETSDAGRAGEWRLVEAGTENAGDSLVEHARCADLVVMSQADPDMDRPDQAGVQKQVIQDSGRPVVVVPNSGDFKSIGNSLLIGWSATREATRALHNAIPFMRDGGEASIIWVSHSRRDGSHLSQTAHEIAVGLDRHGVKTTVTHWDNVDISIGDAILNEAFVSGADLIVTGAFGHSRIYDFVIGATTTHLLEHMTVPILFSN
ncbi:MAG: universal stress protein [Hyphomicrobiales bacterium]|nr:universal stress protein [Hyphomicrobiales bacterium]MCP4998679.1 universal stress protein [Hyphomicrobiales bacterium]